MHNSGGFAACYCKLRKWVEFLEYKVVLINIISTSTALVRYQDHYDMRCVGDLEVRFLSC